MTRREAQRAKHNARVRPQPHVRGAKYSQQLKELNVHKPASTARAKDVATIRALKESLRETWGQFYEKANEYKHYTVRQHKFARFYALNGRSNKSEAVRLAGYVETDPVRILGIANRNLRQPGMEDLVRAYEFEEKAKMKLCVEDVVKWFQDIALAAMETQDFTNANRAMENLAKYLGMFVEKKEVTHRVIQSKQELDARIAELTAVLREAEPEIERNLRIN